MRTASKKLLKYINKQLDLELTQNVLNWCKKLNILSELEIIIGLPYEFNEDFNETIDFIKNNNDNINHLSINQYFVVPSSLIGRNPEKYRVEIVQNTTYDEILKKYLKFNLDVTKNFRVYKYKELDSNRTLNEIETDSLNNYKIISSFLQNPKIKEIDKAYQLKKKISLMK